MLPQSFLFRFSVFACLLSLLTACSGNTSLEDRFAADRNLKNSPGTITSPSPSATPSNSTQATLPDDFPQDIPRYQTAQLIDVETASTSGQVLTRWTTADPSNLVEDFYQQTFPSNNWEIVQPFSSEAGTTNNTLIARRDGLEVKVSILPSSGTTEFVIEYPTQNTQAQSTPTVSPQPSINSDSPLTFSDLDRTPESLRRYVEDLANLGVLTSNANTQGDRFNPNALITRRDYARWLVAANNRLFANVPGKQIRLGSETSQPAFQDVNKTDPDFAAIQALAETGYIPSHLSNDNTIVLFRPNAPLTREDLIAWKVPLDNGKALSAATLDGVKSTWGFQDAAKIDPKAWRSLYADFQNGDQANVRRVFGSTILFQPKKPVTRAEAAAALWYFGLQEDGTSAKDALQTQNQPQTQESPTQP